MNNYYYYYNISYYYIVQYQKITMPRRVSLTRVEIYSAKKYGDNVNLNKYVQTRVSCCGRTETNCIHTMPAVLPAG